MPPWSKARTLAQLAEPLKPQRPPFYVRRRSLSLSLQRHYPADGWYWTPAGSGVAVWLAQTFDEAAHQLRLANARAEADQERADVARASR